MIDNILLPSQLSKRLQDKLSFQNKSDFYFDKQKNDSIQPRKYRSLSDLYTSLDTTSPILQAATNGSLPHTTNRGVSHDVRQNNTNDPLEIIEIIATGRRGGSQLVRIPQPDKKISSSVSFVDYINFTVKTRNFLSIGFTDEDAVINLSKYLQDIFGFGVIEERKHGLNFYKRSFDLGINGWGTVCIGGQNDSILVTVKGQGLMASRSGWQSRLFSFLNAFEDSKITRIDLAQDKFESKTTLNDYLKMYQDGLFSSRGQTPNVEQMGNWIAPNGKGRTLYVGSRSSGKLLRIYEKGLQLAGGFSQLFPNWVRTEIEFSAKQRILSFDMLLKPGQYLAGAYQALSSMHNQQDTVETAKKTVQITVDKALEVTRNQFGKYIWSFIELYGVDEAIKKLTNDKKELPAKLNFSNYSLFDKSLNFEHKYTTEEMILL
jgi:phage replication initiation protein